MRIAHLPPRAQSCACQNPHKDLVSRIVTLVMLRAARRGFSLIEVAVSTAIFLIALVGVFTMIGAALRKDAEQEARQQAAEYAQEALDVVRRLAPENMALQEIPTDPGGNTSAAGQWHRGLRTGETVADLVAASPTSTLVAFSNEGNFRILRYVFCAGVDDVAPTDDCMGDDPTTSVTETDRPLDRRVRITVRHTSFGSSATLSTVVSGNTIAEGGDGNTPPLAPSDLTVSQVSDSTLTASWTKPSSGATSYTLTRNTAADVANVSQEANLATLYYPNYVWTSLAGTDAGRFLRFCVTAIQGALNSDAGCVDFLTRPIEVTATGSNSSMDISFTGVSPYADISPVTPESALNDTTLPGTSPVVAGTVGTGTGGYVIERASGGDFAPVSVNRDSTSAFTDAGDHCSDTYRVTVYRAGKGPASADLVAGRDYATSAEVSATC